MGGEGIDKLRGTTLIKAHLMFPFMRHHWRLLVVSRLNEKAVAGSIVLKWAKWS
jgi:hypothetical protein